ncbi:hypothetical protein NE237_023055 [Protea cynaroides]|uniref:Uncharacterized protein n=1 Tax=Protea cynaroides TaxID=273540 RepID=A0A9Q0HD55_9MAGN|nr:hypothetical protein NE237_023055 [Protea cynaroides]
MKQGSMAMSDDVVGSAVAGRSMEAAENMGHRVNLARGLDLRPIGSVGFRVPAGFVGGQTVHAGKADDTGPAMSFTMGKQSGSERKTPGSNRKSQVGEPMLHIYGVVSEGRSTLVERQRDSLPAMGLSQAGVQTDLRHGWVVTGDAMNQSVNAWGVSVFHMLQRGTAAGSLVKDDDDSGALGVVERQLQWCSNDPVLTKVLWFVRLNRRGRPVFVAAGH